MVQQNVLESFIQQVIHSSKFGHSVIKKSTQVPKTSRYTNLTPVVIKKKGSSLFSKWNCPMGLGPRKKTYPRYKNHNQPKPTNDSTYMNLTGTHYRLV